MSKVTFRLPSKGTQYGYAEYTFDGEMDAFELGVKYKVFVDEFHKGEASGQTISQATKTSVKPLAPVSEVASPTEAELYAALGPNAPDDVQAAAEEMLIHGLGASVYDEPVEEEAAPWEKPPPAPSDDDWDF